MSGEVVVEIGADADLLLVPQNGHEPARSLRFSGSELTLVTMTKWER